MNTDIAATTALSLAAKPVAELPREYLSFRLGREAYGIDILRVQEIRSDESPTRIAMAPAALRGVLDIVRLMGSPEMGLRAKAL